MSLNKAIAHHKEHRKEYTKLCEQVDKSCRPHGGCLFCYGNRMHKTTVKKFDTEEQMKEEL